MAASKRPSSLMSCSAPIAIAPSPISLRDLQIVEAMLADVAPQWTVELHGVSVDDTSLIILPEDGEDALGPSFTINSSDFGLRLDQIHWDELTEIGSFTSLSAAVDAIALILRDFGAPRRLASVTIH